MKVVNNIAKRNRFHKGLGKHMLPYTDNDPVACWKVCRSQHCLNLIENRFWKCPQLRNLQFIEDRFGLADKPEWRN